MISIRMKKSILPTSVIWFADTPAAGRALSLTTYRQCRHARDHPLFVRQPFHTIHIDLTQDQEAIFCAFKKNTRNEIRRAERENVQFGFSTSKDDFVEFFNMFAKSKDRPTISRREIDALQDAVCITEARNRTGVLVMHSYVIDRDGRRARLLHSASEFRNVTSGEQRNAIGRANRFLHYSDMLELKKMNIGTYDLGGYAVTDIDEEKTRINDFKAAFGGAIVEEPDFVSVPLYMALRARDLIVSRRTRSSQQPIQHAEPRG